LVSYLSEIGVGAENNPNATWHEIRGAAGFQPMVIGGRRWYHWVATRMGSDAAGRFDLDAVALMNPSPGWMGVGDYLGEEDYERLGPWSAVWFTSW
jgi:hypothetical protein